MRALICDNCQKQIFNGSIYYTIKLHPNDNDFYIEKKVHICPVCAEKLVVDNIKDM